MSTAAPAFERVALAGRGTDPRVGAAMQQLALHLRGLGRVVLAPDDAILDVAAGEVERLPEGDLAEASDLVVAVGGDGAMLHAARMAASAGVPVLGVNLGRLGFLADVPPERMLDSVDDALAGRCVPEQRMLLTASITDTDGEASGLALNDVVVSKADGGRMLDLRTWVDGGFVNTHGGDGFIVSTATGSTAYALSCSGPIVHPGLEVIVLVPICPHTLSDRPLVVSAASLIEIELVERTDTRAQIICDGLVLRDLEPGTRLRIARAPFTATLLHPPGHDYFRILRSKLHWGRGPRGGEPPAD
jgi:NAD+ kinase